MRASGRGSGRPHHLSRLVSHSPQTHCLRSPSQPAPVSFDKVFLEKDSVEKDGTPRRGVRPRLCELLRRSQNQPRLLLILDAHGLGDSGDWRVETDERVVLRLIISLRALIASLVVGVTLGVIASRGRGNRVRAFHALVPDKFAPPTGFSGHCTAACPRWVRPRWACPPRRFHTAHGNVSSDRYRA